MSEPKYLTKNIPVNFGYWNMQGDLDDVIKLLQDIKTNNPEYEKFNFSMETCHGYDNDIEVEYRVTGYRYETEDEVAARLAIEAKKAASAKASAATRKINAKEKAKILEKLTPEERKVLGL